MVMPRPSSRRGSRQRDPRTRVKDMSLPPATARGATTGRNVGRVGLRMHEWGHIRTPIGD